MQEGPGHCQKASCKKLSGTKGSLSSFKRVPRLLLRQDSTCGNRQHYSSVIHKQGRRHEVGPTLCLTVENLDLVYQEASDSQSPTQARPAERGSRPAIKVRPDHPNRVVSPSRVLPNNMQQVAPASNRPICHEVQQQVASVSPVPDPLATAVNTLSLPWEDLDAYAFPPAAILGKVVEKLQDSPFPGWPNTPWFWDLVAMSRQIPLSLPNLPNLFTQPFNQISNRNLANLNLHAWLLEPQQSRNRASLRQWQKELRLLRSVYEAKWSLFTKWCISHQLDFGAPPLKSVADFLMYLFQDTKLQPSTIDGYRSVIADKLGNSPINVSRDENLTRLLDNFDRDRPKGRRGIPSWNLSLVLNQLTKAPFEPIENFNYLNVAFISYKLSMWD